MSLTRRMPQKNEACFGVNPDNRYHWQEECLAVWEKNNYRGTVEAVTGAGKTMLAVKAMERLLHIYGDNLLTAIVVPTRALMVQWNRSLLSFFLETDLAEKPQFQVYVVNSARYRLARQILDRLRAGGDVFLVADECHHYTSVENRKIFEFIPHMEHLPGHYCAMGLSATVADKDATEILEPALGRIIFRYSYDRALRDGAITAFKLVQTALHFCEDEQQEYDELSERMAVLRTQLYSRYPLLKKDGGSFFAILKTLATEDHSKTGILAKAFLSLSYQRKKLVCMAKNRILCAHELLREMDIRRKVLIFSESIDQAEMLFDRLLPDYGGKVGKYHSRAGKQANENTLERFRNSEILILITCRALDEGIDVPDAEIGIILSGTKMERQRLQRLGRILRKNEKKGAACLYYLFIAESTEEKSYIPLRGECFQVEDREYGKFF